MNAERAARIHDHDVDEWYWSGRLVVYIDCLIWHGSYESACAWAQKNPGVRRSLDTSNPTPTKRSDAEGQ